MRNGVNGPIHHLTTILDNMEYLFIASVIAVVLLVWFKSEAFIEYSRLFGLSKIIKYQEFLDAKLDNFAISYPLFLKLKYPNFFFKLIGCRICLSIWMSAIISAFQWMGITSFIINTSVLTLLSLFMFGVVTKYLNEN